MCMSAAAPLPFPNLRAPLPRQHGGRRAEGGRTCVVERRRAGRGSGFAHPATCGKDSAEARSKEREELFQHSCSVGVRRPERGRLARGRRCDARGARSRGRGTPCVRRSIVGGCSARRATTSTKRASPPSVRSACACVLPHEQPLLSAVEGRTTAAPAPSKARRTNPKRATLQERRARFVFVFALLGGGRDGGTGAGTRGARCRSEATRAHRRRLTATGARCVWRDRGVCTQ